jgi:transposase
LRTSLTHYQRVNVIGALLLTAGGRELELRTRLHAHNVTGDEIIHCLQHLLGRTRGPLLLVWDNAPIHQRRKVQQFIRSQPRMQVENFPRYAPELNPVEFVWTQADEYTAGSAPAHVSELKRNVQAALRRTRRSQRRLRACLKASSLKW